MAASDSGQFKAWNGAEGAAWAGHRDARDDLDAEVCRLLLEAAGIGGRDRVLDIGCGTGETTRLAARRASSGHVVGIDLSEPMLEQARLGTVAAGFGNVAFEQADAQAHPFPEGRFNVGISKYGVMFFADPEVAFTNIGRALRPGGRLAFVCPQPPENCEWYVVSIAALLGITPQPQAVVDRYPGPAPAMFSLSDRVRVGEVLTAAGFTNVSVDPIRVAGYFGRTAADAADAFLASGPTRYIVEQNEGLTWDEAHARLTVVLQAYAEPGGVLIPGAQWLVSATWTVR